MAALVLRVVGRASRRLATGSRTTGLGADAGSAAWAAAGWRRGAAATASASDLDAAATFDIATPRLSDQVPLADGVVGDVVELQVDVGDQVSQGQVVAHIETHKATLAVRSNGDGIVQAILVRLQEEVKELQPLVRVRGTAAYEPTAEG